MPKISNTNPKVCLVEAKGTGLLIAIVAKDNTPMIKDERRATRASFLAEIKDIFTPGFLDFHWGSLILASNNIH
jgi:hypothetical protein